MLPQFTHGFQNSFLALMSKQKKNNSSLMYKGIEANYVTNCKMFCPKSVPFFLIRKNIKEKENNNILALRVLHWTCETI